MAVAGFKQRAFRMNRNIERGSGDEFLVIHISGVHPRRTAVQLAARWPSNPHATEKRVQRNFYAGGEFCNHALAIERDHFRSRVREIIGEKPTPGSEAVTCVENIDVDLLDIDFEHIAGLGFGNRDGTGKNVTAWTFVDDLGMNIAIVLWNGIVLNTAFFHLVQRADRDVANSHSVTGMNRENGFRLH